MTGKHFLDRAHLQPLRWTLGILLVLAIKAGTLSGQETRTSKAQTPAKLAEPLAPPAPRFDPPARVAPRPDLIGKIRKETDVLTQAIDGLKKRRPVDHPLARDLEADLVVLQKAAIWIIRHDEFFTKTDPAATLRALARGLERVQLLSDGKHPWTSASGGTIRGYVSKVDGSVQPYAIYVPKDYDPNVPSRLDVVLHGRGATLHEVRFFDQHDGKPAPNDTKGLVLHVFGRTNNAYRWAGETDVFEAIDAVKRNYCVDEKRIVLRGFSMGGAGAWHLGLHHPDRWVSVEAGAGFAETIQYTRLKNPSEDIRRSLHIYDSIDYALNAFNVPIAGYGGELDPQKAASEQIEKSLKSLGFTMKTEDLVTKAESIDFRRIVGKGMGHKVDPASASLLKTFHDEHTDKGLDSTPKHIRFVTYTLKYPRSFWLSVARLRKHYERTEVDAELNTDEDTVVIQKADNVSVMAVARPIAATIRFGNQSFPLRLGAEGRLPLVYFRQLSDGWEALDYQASRAIEENVQAAKAPGLQGPIDDAFTGAFLCVRGTGQAQNPEVTAWANSRLDQFSKDWSKWMRGELPIKNDTDVSASDLAEHHLIVFGDPGSNGLLRKALANLPITWNSNELILTGKQEARFPSKSHAPILITLNPLNPKKYLVINSGHTFSARDFAGTNALLYPHIGDYAVVPIDKEGSPKLSGFFDERWHRP